MLPLTRVIASLGYKLHFASTVPPGNQPPPTTSDIMTMLREQTATASAPNWTFTDFLFFKDQNSLSTIYIWLNMTTFSGQFTLLLIQVFQSISRSLFFIFYKNSVYGMLKWFVVVIQGGFKKNHKESVNASCLHQPSAWKCPAILQSSSLLLSNKWESREKGATWSIICCTSCCIRITAVGLLTLLDLQHHVKGTLVSKVKWRRNFCVPDIRAVGAKDLKR